MTPQRNDEYIVVIDRALRPKAKRFLICKRHPDGTYYTDSVYSNQQEAVGIAVDLNNGKQQEKTA